MPPRHAKILVDVIANNPRSRNTLEFAIGRHGKGKMDVGHGSDGQLAVVDCDGPQAKNALHDYHQHYPERPVVLLLASEKDLGGYLAGNAGLRTEQVIKPVKLDSMIAAIERGFDRIGKEEPLPPPVDEEESTIALPGGFGGLKEMEKSDGEQQATTLTALQRLQQRIGTVLDPMAPPSHAVGDIDLRDTLAAEMNRLRAGRLLLGRFRDAVHKLPTGNVPLLARLQDKPLFRLRPQDQRVELLVAVENLPALLTQEIADGDFTLQGEVEGEDNKVPTEIFSREAFLWRLALQTYRGMIPEETDPNERVYLSHWPNMTRLDPIPDGLRIAALWNRMPVDLAYTARALKIPQRHVFLFYAAANAIGLAGPARRASNYLFEPELQQGIMPHTILARIAGHFMGHEAAPVTAQETDKPNS